MYNDKDKQVYDSKATAKTCKTLNKYGKQVFGLLENNIPTYRIRFEVRQRRRKLRSVFKCSVTVHDVWNPAYQRKEINYYLIMTGLTKQILNVKEYRQVINILFSRSSDRKNAIYLANRIRNKRSIDISLESYSTCIKKLKQAGISSVTTTCNSLPPVPLI